eukprot:6482528-Amphidinium_carterae.2
MIVCTFEQLRLAILIDMLIHQLMLTCGDDQLTCVSFTRSQTTSEHAHEDEEKKAKGGRTKTSRSFRPEGSLSGVLPSENLRLCL